MARKILRWLQDNATQLQDIDYADDADHDNTKRLVYKRADVNNDVCELVQRKGRVSKAHLITHVPRPRVQNCDGDVRADETEKWNKTIWDEIQI